MTDVRLRPITVEDLDAVLALNQAHVPDVGDLDRARLERLVEQAETAVLAEAAGRLAGFVIALPPGVDYASPNYRWFSARYDDFVYIDRIAVERTVQRAGVGHLLYDAVETGTRAALVCCEVNVRPRNEPSLRFHARRGFDAVGEQDTYGGSVRVVLLARTLGPWSS